MENKPLFCLKSAKIIDNNKSPYVEEKEIEIKLRYFEGEECDKEYGDICEIRRCHYTVLNMKNSEKIWFTCGRRKDNSEW